MAKNGGKRLNAGRKKGIPNLLNLELRRIMLAKLGPEKVLALIEKAHDMAIAGDSFMLTYILNQIYGKPRESITLDADIQLKYQRQDAKDSLKEKLIKLNPANAKIILPEKLSE